MRLDGGREEVANVQFEWQKKLRKHAVKQMAIFPLTEAVRGFLRKMKEAVLAKTFA